MRKYTTQQALHSRSIECLVRTFPGKKCEPCHEKIFGVIKLILPVTEASYMLGLEVTLRERLRTHKFFTKDKCFYLIYHKFSIKSYVLDVY